MRLLGLAVLVLATGAAPPAFTQEGSEGSRAFVESVFAAYAGYGEGVNWPLDGRRLDQVWNPRMADLIRRDRERASRGAAHLASDPLCQCQRWDALTVEGITGGLQNDRRRILRVAFVNGGDRAETYVQLEGNPNQGWRISDVLRPDGSSLAAALAAWKPEGEEGGANGQQARHEPQGAEAFVRAVYASYSVDDATPPMVRGQATVWSDRMNALILRDQELATEDLPYLDADPICNCQDWENLAVRSVRIDREPGGTGVRATVDFVNAGQAATTVLRLRGGPGNWRIDDVLNEGDHPSLAAALAESNRRIEAGGKAYGRD
ncbi:MAG: YbjP/YqhG family protein [Pseudomonadota bacterium]|nr:YbjP/YqhG family protein [Pseudomonadota bacterium]